MKKRFANLQVGQKFKYGDVGFVKIEPAYWGPFRVNARLDKPGETEHYYFTWRDEVEA